MTITEFLLARIAEDEAVARAATDGPWEVEAGDAGHSRYEMNVWVTEKSVGDVVCDMDGLARSHNERYDDDGYADAAHIARHDPARVLAECAAKRKLIRMVMEWPEQHEGWHKLPWYGPGNDVLFTLAVVYKDHEDYDPEWAVN